ncbi:MAG: hypothetical protein KDJ44_04255, partial [Rhodoblastus sp.]|nr:hypothetical protein [Rhodoblastus sp.]
PGRRCEAETEAPRQRGRLHDFDFAAAAQKRDFRLRSFLQLRTKRRVCAQTILPSRLQDLTPF